MYFPSDDTIVAPATPLGAGALSLLRLSGPSALSIVESVVQIKGVKLSDSKGYTAHFGQVFLADGDPLDDVVVTVFRAPHSYTGEDSVELSCHASSYIVNELLRLLKAAGARMADPGEFTRRAYLNGKMDLAQAEAVADVISSNAAASHRVAFHQLRGGVSAELKEMRAALLEMASLLELELDFSEEDVEFADRSQLSALLDKVLAHVNRLTASFRLGNAIKNGIPVAIVGPANAGKSTLLNALVGDERALVSDVAGTTRDTVEERIVLGGYEFRFIDTAGIRDTSETVERMGIERSFRSLSAADIVIIVLDASADGFDQMENLSMILHRLDGSAQKAVIFLNKADLVDEEGLNKNVTMINKNILSIENKIDLLIASAKDENDVQRLREWLIAYESARINHQNSTLITNQRHYDALVSASGSLENVRRGLASSLPSDLLAEDLRAALSYLGSITGEISTAETLNHIFAKHCIGK